MPGPNPDCVAVRPMRHHRDGYTFARRFFALSSMTFRFFQFLFRITGASGGDVFSRNRSICHYRGAEHEVEKSHSRIDRRCFRPHRL